MIDKIVNVVDNFFWKVQNFCKHNNSFVMGFVIFLLLLFSAVGAKWLAVLIALIYIMIKVS